MLECGADAERVELRAGIAAACLIGQGPRGDSGNEESVTVVVPVQKPVQKDELGAVGGRCG
ncbi:hypothetical protein [Streptomyces rapamycinicus]|uniref:Uncharacterized protein n=1 Tax=Streptomyces rapamycinicus TaxID=1226757 RepID=A0ABR6M238_9ACTN|nr:hypothetical protein [Streptomyces rapamycinicus]AGP60184.1 hypothetical protein M271_44080 [Streptomyces rapamycinicus NRRL 5491]MBB4788653.1 hypothetical protein [Streptomyces rapamycinicus]UTP35773.1 hypothetical protein LIV37_44845 [Streptomyces rapamycinicus NRRL 5491]